jgi:hypothetical protein
LEKTASLKINKEHFNGHKLKGIVISAVDSIETRKFIWDELKKQPKVKFYIDTRMGGNLLRIYLVDLSNQKNKRYYERTVKVEEFEHIPCTERTILYNILTMSGLVSNLVTKILKKEKLPLEIIFDLKLLELIKV